MKMRDESPFLGRKREGEARKQEDQKGSFKNEEAASEVRLMGTRLDQDASQVGDVGMALGPTINNSSYNKSSYASTQVAAAAAAQEEGEESKVTDLEVTSLEEGQSQVGEQVR